MQYCTTLKSDYIMSSSPSNSIKQSAPAKPSRSDKISKSPKHAPPPPPTEPSLPAVKPAPPPLPHSKSLPLSKPPPPPKVSLSASSSPGYEKVESGSPTASVDDDGKSSKRSHRSLKKVVSKLNPFRNSYNQDKNVNESSKSPKSNPFRDSYKEEEDDPSAASSTAISTATIDSVSATQSKKSNPFRDSYKEEEEEVETKPSISTKSNPFDIEVQNLDRQSRLLRQSPRTKIAMSKANPLLSPINGENDGDMGTVSEHGQEFSSETAVVVSTGMLKGEPGNPIYYLNRFSDLWLLAFIFAHTGQFVLLLNVGYKALPDGAFGVVLFLAFAVVALLLAARYMTRKSRLAERRNIELNNGICTPQDEADVVPDSAVMMIAAAAITEGFAFAIFTAVSSGNYQYLDQDGFYTKGTLLQVLRFASITLLGLHRTLRPANRLDPMRTVLELEVISVCWDALDGSTLYELLDGNSDLSSSMSNSIRVLMAAWYISVGFRMALMFLTNMSPSSHLHSMVITAPFQLATQPTVDRTLQGLRLKSIITISMAMADLYAAFLRTVIWSQGHLDALQQDMCIKNYLFLSSVASAYYNYQNTSKKEWNARELIDYPCEVKIPLRIHQLEFFRWAFVVSYALIAGLSTAILMAAMDDGRRLAMNLIADAVLLLIFIVYAKNAHVHNPNHEPTAFFKPHSSFFTFPGKMAAVLSVLLATSLMGARLPAMYFHYASMAPEGSGESYTYNNAMLLVVFTIVPLACFGSFWATSYMLFRKEFTAAPGSYHAIHDPSIIMVASATTVEGALDVLSAAVLMQLAANDLPDHVNNAIVLFCLLELINAGQCFALPCMLSGGKEDTPKDLVRYNAYLRLARGLIDFGTIVLRVVLWIRYNAVSSVFLVKNLYNLIHTATQVDRHLGVRFYPAGTLFSEYVPSYDWYGMTRTQWRVAIHAERSIASPTNLAGAVGNAASLRV